MKENKKKCSIPADESRSFTEIFETFEKKKLYMRKILDYCVTGRPWALVNEDDESRNNRKSVFRNHIPIPIPKNIKTSIVDAMRLVRMVCLVY